MDDELVLASLRRETEALRRLRTLAQRHDADFVQGVMDKIFADDINSLLQLEDLWEGRTRPKPLQCKMEQLAVFDKSSSDAHQLWSVEEWISLFGQSLERIRDRCYPSEDGGGEFNEIHFDKDDDDVMDFIASAANIRASIFGVPLSSQFSLKCNPRLVLSCPVPSSSPSLP